MKHLITAILLSTLTSGAAMAAGPLGNLGNDGGRTPVPPKKNAPVTTATDGTLITTLPASTTPMPTTSSIPNNGSATKALGEGYSVTSTGDILRAGSSSPIARITSAGNIISATDKKLDATTQSELNRLIKTSPAIGTLTTVKSIGEGFSVTSAGDILKAGSSLPIAKIDSAGNIISATDKKLEAVTQSALNRLTKGIKLPFGFGGGDRVDPRIVQKNTYVAATDDGNVYYGGNGLTGGSAANSAATALIKAAESKLPRIGVGSLAPINFGTIKGLASDTAQREWASMTETQQTAWLASHPASTSSTAISTLPTGSGFRLQPGTNQIVSPNGTLVATYNPANGQFTDAQGAAVSVSSPEYEVYKTAIADSYVKSESADNDTLSGTDGARPY